MKTTTDSFWKRDKLGKQISAVVYVLGGSTLSAYGLKNSLVLILMLPTVIGAYGLIYYSQKEGKNK